MEQILNQKENKKNFLNEIVVKIEADDNKKVIYCNLKVNTNKKNTLFEELLDSMMKGKASLLKYLHNNIRDYKEDSKYSLIQGFEYGLIEPSKKDNVLFDINDLTGSNETVKRISKVGIDYRF